MWQDRCQYENSSTHIHVLRGRCNSEPAVIVRDPYGPVRERPVDLVELRDRR